jgi:F-type H+-transporting ATPase subunit c
MKSKITLALALMLLIAMPTFAQESGAATGGSQGYLLPVAFAIALASGLCGMAQGKAIAAAMEGIARNPSAGGAIRTAMILGLAFIESLALFTLIIVFLG